jgi:hypothetical protein
MPEPSRLPHNPRQNYSQAEHEYYQERKRSSGFSAKHLFSSMGLGSWTALPSFDQSIIIKPSSVPPLFMRSMMCRLVS